MTGRPLTEHLRPLHSSRPLSMPPLGEGLLLCLRRVPAPNATVFGAAVTTPWLRKETNKGQVCGVLMAWDSLHGGENQPPCGWKPKGLPEAACNPVQSRNRGGLTLLSATRCTWAWFFSPRNMGPNLVSWELALREWVITECWLCLPGSCVSCC